MVLSINNKTKLAKQFSQKLYIISTIFNFKNNCSGLMAKVLKVIVVVVISLTIER